MDFDILAKRPNVVTVGALVGDKISHQASLFKLAVENVKNYYHERNIDIKFECLNCDDVNEKNWSHHDLFTFLRRNDIHVIPTHGYQSNVVQSCWKLDSYLEHLESLKYHIGYPMGKYIMCPVFLQDKWEYLNKLNHYCIPTFKIQMPMLHNGSMAMVGYEVDMLKKFVKKLSSRFDNKFVGN